MMLYFDKRAEHILHKDEAASGSLHYMLFYPHLEYLCAIGQNKVVFHCCDSICTLTWLYLTLFAYNCIRMLLVGQRRSYASICLSVRLSVGYFLPAVSGGGCSPDNWSQCCSCISFHKIYGCLTFWLVRSLCSLHRPNMLCFSHSVSVCLQDNSKSCRRILMSFFRIGMYD